MQIHFFMSVCKPFSHLSQTNRSRKFSKLFFTSFLLTQIHFKIHNTRLKEFTNILIHSEISISIFHFPNSKFTLRIRTIFRRNPPYLPTENFSDFRNFRDFQNLLIGMPNWRRLKCTTHRTRRSADASQRKRKYFEFSGLQKTAKRTKNQNQKHRRRQHDNFQPLNGGDVHDTEKKKTQKWQTHKKPNAGRALGAAALRWALNPDVDVDAEYFGCSGVSVYQRVEWM